MCRYCQFIAKDPQEMYQTVHAGQLYSFFEWLLSQKSGKGKEKTWHQAQEFVGYILESLLSCV